MSGNECQVCHAQIPVVDGRSRRRLTCSVTCTNALRRQRHVPRPPRELRPLADRLWVRVNKQPDDGCWEWTGYRRPAGYGQIGRGRSGEGIVETHRLAWELANGPIPDGMFVCHRCDNPPCCRPDHLFLGSHLDNMADMVSKGRGARGDRLPHTKLTDDEVRAIRAEYVLKYGPPKRGGRRSNAPELAEKYGISQIYVSQLVHGHYRKDVA